MASQVGSGVQPFGMRRRYLGAPPLENAGIDGRWKRRERHSPGVAVLVLGKALSSRYRKLLHAHDKKVEEERARGDLHGVEREADLLDLGVDPGREGASNSGFDEPDAIHDERELVVFGVVDRAVVRAVGLCRVP